MNSALVINQNQANQPNNQKMIFGKKTNKSSYSNMYSHKNMPQIQMQGHTGLVQQHNNYFKNPKE